MLGNYKIRVKNKEERKEAQELFFELGCVVVNHRDNDRGFIVASKEAKSPIHFDYWCVVEKEITLPKLRDMVVLHRNDVNDWNCVDPEFKDQKLYLCNDKTLHVFDDARNYWKVSSKNGVDLVLNRLIMKGDESLNSLISVISEGLICGADALRALGDGKEVEFKCGGSSWRLLDAKQQPLEILIDQKVQFRLKSTTIKLEIEIPKPFKPKVGDTAYFLSTSNSCGYTCTNDFKGYGFDSLIQFGAWQTEEQIKQVVEVLSSLRNDIKGVDNV